MKLKIIEKKLWVIETNMLFSSLSMLGAQNRHSVEKYKLNANVSDVQNYLGRN